MLKLNATQSPIWRDDQVSAGVELDRVYIGADLDGLSCRSKMGVVMSLILSAETDTPRVIAVLINEIEHSEAKSSRFQLTPVAFELNIAAHYETPWLLVLHKDQIRLYLGKVGDSVGQECQTEMSFEVALSTIDDEYAAVLPLMFSATALQMNGMSSAMLDESNRYATRLVRDFVNVFMLMWLWTAVKGRSQT